MSLFVVQIKELRREAVIKRRVSLGLFHLSEFTECKEDSLKKTLNFRLNKKDYKGDWEQLIDRSKQSPFDIGFKLDKNQNYYLRVKSVSDVYVTEGNEYIHIIARTRSSSERDHLKRSYGQARRTKYQGGKG